MSAVLEPAAVSTARFAELLGLTRGRVTQLVAMGLPRDEKTKRIPVDAARAWVAANIRPRAKADMSDARQASRAERERHEAELSRLKVEERAGKLVSKDDVRAAAFERARFERDAHLGFVPRAAAMLAADLGADEASVFALLDRVMREHLTRLAETATPEACP